MTQQVAQKVVIFLPDELYGEVLRAARQAHPLRSVPTQVVKIVEKWAIGQVRAQAGLPGLELGRPEA